MEALKLKFVESIARTLTYNFQLALETRDGQEGWFSVAPPLPLS